MLIGFFRSFDTMPKKRKACGKPFEAKDPRINTTGPPTNPPPETAKIKSRFREPKSVYDQISKTNFQGEVPPGAQLRPFADKNECEDEEFHPESQNWVVDNEKLLHATNDAYKQHDQSSSRNHTAIFKRKKVIQLGFGISVSFKCCYRNCKFDSKLYKLYDETARGEPTTNVQVGVAMAKSELTPKTVEVLGSTMNMSTPSRYTLQNKYSSSLECTNELAESAMEENRRIVTSAIRLQGKLEKDRIPSVEVATDGQYSNRSYHFPTGKSDSCSNPVIEQVTGLGLLISHENLSHRDGSLPQDVHINSAETIAVQRNLEKSHSATNFPLYYGVVTVDGDAGVARGLQTAQSNVGESRPLKRRGCHFHGEGAGIKMKK